MSLSMVWSFSLQNEIPLGARHVVPDAEGHSLRRVRTVLWVLRGGTDRLPRGSVKRREQQRASRILPGKGAVGWSRVRQTEVQNMQHIQVGKWACATRGGQEGSERQHGG